MVATDIEPDTDTSSIKNHEEILQLIDEIRSFEINFEGYEIVKEEVEKEELIEVEHEKPEEITPIPIKEEKDKLLLRSRLSKKRVEKPITPTTFRIRYADDGSLVNVDFRAPKPKKEGTKGFSLKKLRRKKCKSTGEAEAGEKKSKLKGGLGRLGKLKKVIPSRGKKEEKSEEDKT